MPRNDPAFSAPNNQAIRVELVGYRSRRGRFVGVSQTARDRQRTTAVKWLRTATGVAKHESPLAQRKRAANDPRRRRPTPARFRDSWQPEYRENAGGAEAWLTNTAPHAGFVIYPTRPHAITPRRARRLIFEPHGAGTGIFVYAKRVRHPGTRGNNVPERVLRAMESWGRDELARVAGEVRADLVKVFTT